MSSTNNAIERQNEDSRSTDQLQALGKISNLSGLTEVEQLIRQKLQSEVQQLTDIPTYLLELGGKRIRPALTFLIASVFGLKKPTQELIDIATGIELIHMATLLHDDIIDKAPIRRGKPSSIVTHGQSATLLAGDFLFIRAFSLCAHLDRFIIDATEQACIELTEGELEEELFSWAPFNFDQAKEKSLIIAKKKTGSLFALACSSGAFYAGLSPELSTKLSEFGYELGIAFQIIDDILDVVSDEQTLGKQPGADIRERAPSFVNVSWRQTDSQLSVELLCAQSKEYSSIKIEQARNQIKLNLKASYQEAHKHSERALQILSEVIEIAPSIDAQSLQVLRELIEYGLKRAS